MPMTNLDTQRHNYRDGSRKTEVLTPKTQHPKPKKINT